MRPVHQEVREWTANLAAERTEANSHAAPIPIEDAHDLARDAHCTGFTGQIEIDMSSAAEFIDRGGAQKQSGTREIFDDPIANDICRSVVRAQRYRYPLRMSTVIHVV